MAEHIQYQYHGSVVERRSPELHTDLVRVRASVRTENISVWMMH